MPRDGVRLYLFDMLQAIEKVERYIAGLSFEEFEANDLVTDAVVRNLEIVGEAAKYIPEELRDRYPAAEWTRVVGFHNIVIHQYRSVVWTSSGP